MLAVACTDDSASDEPVGGTLADRAGEPGSTGPRSEFSPPEPMVRGEPADDLLGVLDDEGNLVALHPDGSDPVVIAVGAEAAISVSQPAFSPDGTRLAWSELRPLPGVDAFQTFLVTGNVDGSSPTETETPFLSFYNYWDPTSNRVAIIGNVADSVGLALAEVADGARSALPISSGIPFHISWNPEGSILLARVGDELRIVSDIGDTDVLFPVTADYRVPVWSADNDLIFPENQAGVQELVRVDVGTDERDALAAYGGQLVFIVDAAASRTALQTSTSLDASDEDVTAALVLSPGLAVLDLDTGRLARITDEPAVAFYFSPDGSRLLLLTVDENLAAEDAPFDEVVYAESWLRWQLWDDEGLRPLARFRPSFVSIQYLLFFEQYAQSHTFWSPDGQSFVFAGTLDDDGADDGIWVQDVSGDAPRRVTDGTLAFWSPT